MINPYSGIIKVIGNKNKNDSPTIQIGRVVHVEESNDRLVNLKIKINDLEIDKKNLYINDTLTKEHKRMFRTDVILKPKVTSLTNLVNDGGEHASDHMHELESLKILDSNIYTRDTLKVDDLVSVLAVSDKQTYIILNRVVRL